jgi:hypothetical protein
MPRELPTGLVALLKSGFAETHSTLAITLIGAGRSINQTIYLATAAEGGQNAPPVTAPPPAPLTIPNAGFEAPILAPPGYAFNPAGASWTLAGSSGLIQGGLFGAAAAPEGGQVAFLQEASGVISQVLTGFIAGVNYDVKFKACQQFVDHTEDFDVYMDAILIGNAKPAGVAFQQFSFPFASGQTSYTLKFQGKNTAAYAGNTAYIDDVQIVPSSGGISRPPGGRGVEYLPRLRSTGPVAMSLTRSADRVDVVVENIDRLTGNQLVAVQDVLYGSFAEFGRLWRDLRNPANVYQVTLLTGQVVAARASETEVQLTLMSDIYSSGAIAGQIIYGRSCPWTFKDAATCAYAGPLATCNKLLDSPDGCAGRSNEFHFGGFPYIKSVDTISGASALQQNVQYQTIIQPAALTAAELEAGARATTAIIQRHNLLLQGFTVTDDAVNDATKIVAGGVGGANYQTLKENDGYSYVRTLPPQPTLNFLNSFKLKDDPGNLETDITTYGVPTGQLNVRTDFSASGSIDVSTVVTFNIGGIVTLADVLNLQPGMGILVEGAGFGGADFLGTVGAVSADGKTYVLTTGFTQAPPAGARVQADDTVAVQAWITAHGDLAMPPGYYRLTNSIVVPSTSEGFSVIVHGSGWDLSVFAFQHGGDGFIPTAPDRKIDSLVFKDLSVATGTKWDNTGLLDANNHGFGLRMTAPTLTGIYNDCVLERCRVIGWGRFGLLSDNAEVCWITQCIFRENKHGHVALLAPDQIEAPKQPNANTLTSCTFDQAFGGGDATRTGTGAMTAARAEPPPLTQAEIDAARTLTLSGISLTAADRGRLVIVQGVGTNVSNLYSFIDVVLSSSSCRLGHDCRSSSGSAPVTVFSSSVASIFLNRAHDTVIDGATIQGNFTNALTGVDCNAIRADGCANLRIVGVHEEDAGGVGGAAVRLENCQSVTIENWGGTSAGPPAFTNAHGADFQLINTHGVRVSQCYFNDRPQFVMDGNSDAEIDNSLVTGHNNLWQGDGSWERLKIGSGVRTYQAADARTNQTAGNEYMYDGLLAREVLLNSRFIDAPAPSTTSWTTAQPTWWSLVYGSPERFDSYLRVNATAEAAGGGQKIFSQTVAVPDSIPAGSWILGVDWYIESDAHVTATGAYVEVRLKPSTGVEETLQWSSRAYTYITGVWNVGQVKAWLGTGTGRTIEVQINVTPGPSNPIIRLTNFRLTRGKHSFGAWARPVTDFGGKMRAPLEFEPIAIPPAAGGYPPPPAGSPVLSIVNIAGVLNQGKNGAYTPLGTTGTGGPISGPPNYYAIFNAAGNNLDYASIRQDAPGIVHILNVPLWIDRQRALISDYTSSGLKATIAICDYDDVVYFGPDFNAAGAQTGTNVVIRAAHGDVSSLQISGAGRRMTFNSDLALTGVTPPLPTFFVGISDLSLDGLRIQQTVAGLYVGYMLSCFFSGTATDALFAVDQKGGLARLNNLSYLQWPINHGPGGATVLTNNGSGTLTWAPASGGGHVIQDEGVPLTAQAALNFTGAGVTASNVGAATNVKVETAGVAQEGAVSISPQHFSGAKFFHNGVTVYLDSAGSAVALVVQSTNGTVGAHIQDWWGGGGTAIASINDQPILRLGIPAGRAGFVELCNDTGSGTIQLAGGQGQAVSYTLKFPAAAPVVGSTLQVLNAGGQLVWSAAGASGHVIYEETTPLAQRANLKFQGSGVTATDNGTDTVITLNPATATLEGIVSSIGQTFGGRKTFNAGATMLGLASTVPVLTVALAVGASPTGRLQEWQDANGQVLGYVDQTPAFHLGAQGFTTGMLELASASSANFTTLRAATFPAASLIYVLPVVNPAPGQVLGVDTVVGSVVNTKWQTSGGAGNVTVTAPQGTERYVPRWSGTGTATTTTLVDSAIWDRTATGGTLEIACNQLLFHRMDGTDLQDFYQRAGSGAGAIWRVDRRTGSYPPNGMADALNTIELQLHFEPTSGGGPGDHPFFLAGDKHSWFQCGLRVRPHSTNVGVMGNTFEVQDAGGVQKFAVAQSGNLAIISGVTGYNWPGAHAVGFLQNNGSGNLSWGSGGSAHIIQEDGTDLAAQPRLNFQGAGVTAANVGAVTNVKVETAGQFQEGAVSVGTQHFGGAKFFHNATTIYESAGIPLVLQYTGVGSTSHIQDWWITGTTPIAYIDAQPVLRLGIPAGRQGYLELCNSSTANTVQLGVSSGPQSMIINFPGAWPVNNQYLQVASTGGGVVNLQWQTITPGGGAGSGTNNTLARWTTTAGVLQDSGIADTVASGAGSAGFGIIINRDFLYGRLDGTLNLGDTTTRIGGVFVKNNFWMWAGANAGNSASSPTTMGFLSGGASTYSRILVSGNENCIQGSPQNGRMTLAAYHAIELRGSRRQTSAPSVSTTVGDGYGVLVFQDIFDFVPFMVDTQFNAASDLTRWQNNGALQAAIGPAGSLRCGGIGGRVVQVNPGGGATLNLNQAPYLDAHFLIFEMVNGSFSVIMPPLSALIDGREYYFLMKSKTAGGILGVKTQGSPVQNQINEFAMTSGSVWNLNNSDQSQRFTLWVADYVNNNWRLVEFGLSP